MKASYVASSQCYEFATAASFPYFTGVWQARQNRFKESLLCGKHEASEDIYRSDCAAKSTEGVPQMNPDAMYEIFGLVATSFDC